MNCNVKLSFVNRQLKRFFCFSKFKHHVSYRPPSEASLEGMLNIAEHFLHAALLSVVPLRLENAQMDPLGESDDLSFLCMGVVSFRSIKELLRLQQSDKTPSSRSASPRRARGC